MKIPFSWLPASWGLKGKSRAIAEAEYSYTGYELECALARINYEDPIEQELKFAEIDLKYNKIDQYEADKRINRAKASKDQDEKAAEILMLDIDLKHGRITGQEYERKKADLTGEPWIAMPKISWDPDNPSKTYFELDYNDHFVRYLRENGYNMQSDDDCISRWLNDVCLSITEDMAQTDPDFVTAIRKVRLPDGKTEHS